MSVYYVNARCRKILRFLIGCKTYATMQDIAREVSASKRSVYYDICKINELLRTNGIQEIEPVRGRGILLPDRDKALIAEILDRPCQEEDYIFSPNERVRLIICYLIASRRAVYIEQLSDFCKVSRNTIFNDFRMVSKLLSEYDAQLDYDVKTGYQIAGNPIKVRAMFLCLYEGLLPLIVKGTVTLFDTEEVKESYRRLKAIEKRLNTEYVEGILRSLAALLPIIGSSDVELKFPGLHREQIQVTKEYHLVSEFFPDLSGQEKVYLALHLLGSRMATIPEQLIRNDADQTVYEITKDLVSEFERVACVYFENRDELERTLFVHISTSMYRYQYGIQLGNPMKDDVVREYPSLFQITKMVSAHLSQIIGIPISDDEVAYLALHFGAYLKRSEKREEEFRILLVSANGTSAGNMLRKEVQRLLPKANIVDVVTSLEGVDVENCCELLISTLPVRCRVPCIIVHPVLSPGDKKSILDHSLTRRCGTQMVNRVFQAIQPYISPENGDAVYQELRLCLQERNKLAEPVGSKKPNMLDFLYRDRVRVVESHCDWQTAIWESGRILLREGSISEGYLSSIVRQTERYGSYMMLAPGLFLAHARPEDGAHHLDLCLTTFAEPVIFPDGNQAQFIFMLAAIDQEQHLKILEDILHYFSDADFRREILCLRDKTTILSWLEYRRIEESKEELC